MKGAVLLLCVMAAAVLVAAEEVEVFDAGEVDVAGGVDVEARRPRGRCPAADPASGRVKFLKDRRDCSKFYICSGGQAFEFLCPAQLYFNSRTKQCDYPENVKC